MVKPGSHEDYLRKTPEVKQNDETAIPESKGEATACHRAQETENETPVWQRAPETSAAHSHFK